jgi:hypothetical protein
VGDVFDSAFEIRGITTPAYYRLLIPELIPEYDKVIYSDVDVLFRMDLSDLYSMDIDDYYLAATRDVGLNLSKDGVEYISSIPELEADNYLQSGFIMLNCRKISDDCLVAKFKELAKRKLKFQDQDILNIACRRKVRFLPMVYNMTDYSFYYAMKERQLLYKWCDDSSIDYAINNGKRGVMSLGGEVIVDIVYDDVDELGEHSFVVVNKLKKGVVSFDGKNIVDTIYDEIEILGGAYLVENDSKKGIVSFSGKTIIDIIFDKIDILGNAYVVINKGQKELFHWMV